MLVSLHEAPTSTLRAILRDFGNARAYTLTRRVCIHVLERVHNVFVVSEDGTEYGIGDVHHSDDFISTLTESDARQMAPLVPKSVLMLNFQSNIPSDGVVGRLRTDTKHDVIVADIIKVHNNVHFAPETSLTDIHNELLVSRNLLNVINHETGALLSNIDTFNLQLSNPVDIATTNQLGTAYGLNVHVDNGTVEYDNGMFRYFRSDQFVFVNIQFRVTKCDDVAMLTIDLPYSIRAEYVPFQATLKETDSTDFSGMARAYGRRGRKVFVESYVFQELPMYINIRGQYLSSLDEPFIDKPFTWITPMRYDTNHNVYLNRDMVRMREVPTRSDLGFSDGHLSWTCVQDRVDITGYVRFSQRTSVDVPVVRCDIDIPITLERLHARSHGYGATYAIEHNRFLSDRPVITVRPEFPKFQMAIDARTRRVPFHDIVVQLQVSLFVTPRHNIHNLEKPNVQSHLEIVNNNILISNVRLFDTWAPKSLLHTYNMDIRLVNDNNAYQQYRFTPLTMTLQHTLSFQTLTIFDIRLYNQMDDQHVQYLYPRRKEYNMTIHAKNYLNDSENGYEGPFELTPDLSTYLTI